VPGGDTVHGTGRDLHGMTPAQFWRYIRKAPIDQHWARQSDLLDGLDVKLIRLDDLTEWWKTTKSKVPLIRTNSTEGRVPSDWPLEQAILKYYAEDVKLYEEAKP